MSNYFKFFPDIEYGEKVIKNICRRVMFSDTIGSNPYVFLPYVIKEDERPEDVSYYYYDSVDYVWLIYLANNIIDPKYDWPMSQNNLNNFIIQKYRSSANTTGNDVLNWSKNTQITDNILYYENSEFDRITTKTYELESAFQNSDFISGDWTPIRVYDYEFDRNENKRHIQLVDASYALQMQNDLRENLK